MNSLFFAAGADHFTIFTTFFRLHEKFLHVATSALITFFLVTLALHLHRTYKATPDPLIPDARFSLRNVFEVTIERLFLFFQGFLGKEAVHHFPLLATIFFFILTSNLLGMVPGFTPPTDNVSTNFAISLTVFAWYNYHGVKSQGLKNYILHFGAGLKNPFFFTLIFCIEIIGHLVRPVSLSLRLAGNMQGDHKVLEIFSGLTPFFIPIVFMALGFLVSVLQAFVFTFLSTIYIAMSAEHDH